MGVALCRVIDIINFIHEIINVYTLFNRKLNVFFYVKGILVSRKSIDAVTAFCIRNDRTVLRNFIHFGTGPFMEPL
jgi:hypothetical protein